MVGFDPFQIYNTAIGFLTAFGLIYLLYSQQYLVKYRRFLDFFAIGFLLFTIGGPLADFIAPSWVHVVHGLAATFVVLGLYDPVRNEVRRGEWVELLLNDPSIVRPLSEWMTPMDLEILKLFHSSDLVLTPSIIAYNLNYSREAVSRRLSELQEHAFVENIERGKYQMTVVGEQYIKGELRPNLSINDEGNGFNSVY